MACRAEFLAPVKSVIALAANHRCVRPGCGVLTHAYHAATGKILNLGIAAHDVAASRNGPRGHCDISEEQRRAYQNGAWLCRICSVTVDLLPSNYPVGTITAWQRDASDALAKGALRPFGQHHVNIRDACAAANRFCRRLSQVGLGGFRPHLEFSYEHIRDVRSLLQDCLNFGPLNYLCSLYLHTSNIQRQMLESLQSLADEVTGSQFWTADSYSKMYRCNGDDLAVISAEKVCALWNDITAMYQKLAHFAKTGQVSAHSLDLW